MQLPHPFTSLLLSASTLLASPALAGDVSYFVGPPDGLGDVQVVDEAGLGGVETAPGLAGIELLPIEVAGRTRVSEFQPDRARRLQISAGLTRLALPAAKGSLYRFRRPAQDLSAEYGFFRVDPDGAAAVLFELAGTGPGANVDPFVDRIAVAPDGASFLVATTLAAGGDLIEVGVDGASEHRTLALPPFEANGPGLALFTAWGTAAGPGGAVRFERVPGAAAEAVAFPGNPSWFGGEVAGSPNGGHAVTTAGPNPMEAFVYSYGRSGNALQATTTAQPITGAGYLPEHLAGPFLAVADGGNVVAWRTEVDLVREVWIGAPAAGAFQLTADELYLDTLDTAGVIGFQSNGKLLMAVGEAPELGEEGLESMDLYLVDVSTGAPAIANLSQSSGLAQPPFFVKSDIDPEDGLYAIPGTDWILLHNSQGSSGELLAIDTGSGSVKTVLDEVKSLDLVEVAADSVLVSVRRTNAAEQRELVRLDAATLTPSLLTSAPDEAVFKHPAVRPDGQVGLVVELFGLEWLARFDAANGEGGLFLSIPLSYGTSTAFSPSGALLFTAGAAGFPGFGLAWPDAGPIALTLPTAFDGLVLPGV